MNGAHVLVVDDDEAIRDSVALVLREAGFLVHTARHGAEALAWLRAHRARAGLVLLDLMMPIMDGYTFLRAKEEDPLIAHVPVVVITASRECAQVMRRHQVQQCLSKPVAFERLHQAVIACCRTPEVDPDDASDR